MKDLDFDVLESRKPVIKGNGENLMYNIYYQHTYKTRRHYSALLHAFRGYSRNNAHSFASPRIQFTTTSSVNE